MASANLKKFTHSSAINLILQPLQMGSFLSKKPQILNFIRSIQKLDMQNAWVLAYICCFLRFVAFSCLCFCIKFCKFAKDTSKINAISNLMSHFLQTSIFVKIPKTLNFICRLKRERDYFFKTLYRFCLTQKTAHSVKFNPKNPSKFQTHFLAFYNITFSHQKSKIYQSF